MLFDSHAHLNFEAFQDDWKDVLADCQKNDVWVVNIGSQYPTSKRAIEIAEQYEKGVYASIGVHPIHAHEQENAFEYKKFKDLILSRGHCHVAPKAFGAPRNDKKKIVAIGETGLDFFHSDEYFDIQKKIFIDQIRLAKEFALPLVIHGRNSKDGTPLRHPLRQGYAGQEGYGGQEINCYEEIYKIVKKEKVKNAVVHCFGGTADEAKRFLDLGFYIGITGIVTFSPHGGSPAGRKNAQYQAIVRDVIPLEKILIETDSPYLAPDPHRDKRNLPQYVEFVAKKIAELKGRPNNEVAEITSQNAIDFYNI